MRQPTNLRGATLPGLSQPSEKEGPRHRSFWLPRLQRQAGSLLLWLWGGGPSSMFEATKHDCPLSPLPSPFREGAGRSSRARSFCEWDCQDGYAGIVESLTQCGSWLLPRQKPDIWTAQAILLHAAGLVTSITASWGPMAHESGRRSLNLE